MREGEREFEGKKKGKKNRGEKRVLKRQDIQGSGPLVKKGNKIK